MMKFIRKNLFSILLLILLVCLVITYSIRTYNMMYKYNVVIKEHELLQEQIDSMEIVIDSLANFSAKIKPKSNWDPLVSAMIYVESRGNEMAIGNSGDYGVLQIRKIVVDECNNILKSKNIDMSYEHEDAFTKTKSIEMFHIIAEKYAPDGDFEKMARIWNGGPTAHMKYIKKNDSIVENPAYIKTNYYWAQVKNELDRQIYI